MPDASNGKGPASDEFDRELRELTEGTAGEPLFIEPSAAERGKAGAQWVMQVRRGDRGRMSGALFLVAVMLMGTLLAWLVYSRSAINSAISRGAAPASAAPQASLGPELTGTISPIDLFAAPPTDPFARTVADHWADGAAGIVAPVARATGGFTARQVAAAFASARALLIAANLDPRTLLGGPPTDFARLLTRAQRAAFLAGLNKVGADKAGNPLSTRTWVASFAPGSAELVGSVIKVHGTMSARIVRRAGTEALAVEVNYLFVYAIEPPHDPTDWMRVVDHEYGDIDFARPAHPAGPLEPSDQAVLVRAGIQCGADDGYSHPAYPSDRSIDSHQSGAAASPYSMAPPPRGMVCGPVTGT